MQKSFRIEGRRMKIQIKKYFFALGVVLLFVFGACKQEEEILEKYYPYYYVTFHNPYGSSHIEPQYIQEGKTVTRPSDPVRNGYSFDGWYSSDGSLFDFSKPVTCDIYLTARFIDLTPPGVIRNLGGNSGDGSVQLSWENPADIDFSKVEITFTPTVQGITQPIILKSSRGLKGGRLIDGLSNGTEYTFTLVAVDINNNKSQGVSVAVTPEKPADVTPPAEIRSLSAIGKHNRIELTWTNPSDEDFNSVEISAIPAEGSLEQTVILTGSSATQGNYIANNLQNGKEYVFTIKTIDICNNKSSGITKKFAPAESKISLSASLPNDNGNIVLTNDKAPVKVSVSSTNTLTKAVWKKVDENASSSAEILLNDASAESLLVSANSLETFYVTENGFYDIAVQNEEGVSDCTRVEVKTIDKTPLSEVSNLSVSSDGSYITFKWENPSSENEYDSSLKSIKVSYVFNDDQSDVNNGSKILNSYANSYSLSIPSGKNEDDYVKINVQTVDYVGNISDGLYEKTWCCYCIYGNDPDLFDKICHLSGMFVKVVGIPDDISNFNSACFKLRGLTHNGEKKRIDLDLSDADITEISDNEFYKNTSLRKVILPETVTSIGSMAFYGCTNLTDINIPAAVKSIGQSAFEKCESLETIDIPGILDKFDSNVFADCTKLKSVYIKNIQPRSSGLSAGTFYNCKMLETVVIDHANCIENCAFYGCESLKEITIPNHCFWIEEKAFSGCSNLSKVTIDPDIHCIQYSAFENCPKLQDVVFLDTGLLWYRLKEEEKRIGFSTKKVSLGGESMGLYFFGKDSKINAKYLTQDYVNYSFYDNSYFPLKSE